MKEIRQIYISDGVRKLLLITLGFGVLSVLFTVLTGHVDVQPIGPMFSEVGFAALNGKVHEITGYNETLYKATELLGVIPVLSAAAFAAFGAMQFIKTKSLAKVDRSILLLGAFYVLVAAVYVFFEAAKINYRPVILESELEASYPSSHTVLAICFSAAASVESGLLLKNERFAGAVRIAMTVVMALIILGRALSGVHWLTDILGGVLISTTLVLFYYAAVVAADENALL